MKNIISNLVMLIDLYYYRKRLMKRWRSIKHYQRIGKIKSKITKGEYPSHQIPISPNPPKPTKKVIEPRVRQAPPPPPRPKQINPALTAAEKAVKEGLCDSILDYMYPINGTRGVSHLISEDFKEMLKERGALLKFISGSLYDVVRIDIEYKGYKKQIQLTDHISRLQVEDYITRSLDEIDREINRLVELSKSVEPYKISDELSEFLKVNNVQIQLQLNKDPKLDVYGYLKVIYKGKEYTETFFSKPLNIDIKNVVRKVIMQKLSIPSHMGINLHNPYISHMGLEVFNPLSIHKLQTIK